jgi:hypothetical protein
MLRAYRVVTGFAAKQIRRGPLHMESFEPGELLVVLSSEDGETTFCLYDHPITDLNARPRFTISDERFALMTVPE